MLDQHQTPLLTTLLACGRRHHAGFYVPGHKRGRGLPPSVLHAFGPQAFQFDVPELPELDDLFAPTGVIQRAQALAAAAFGADRTWFLTNGSTCGVVAALLATCGPGDQVILPRNVHGSVISGLVLSGAHPVFVNPVYDCQFDLHYCLTPEAVARALHHYPQVKAVLAVSPTYEGICGDLAALADQAHGHGIPLLVDEAHGPHFAWHPALPTPALAQGADLVVQSTHKTLGAITQAAMLHGQGQRIDPIRVDRALRLVQSTSPNYVLLASLDAARHQMVQEGTAIYEQLWRSTQGARAQIQGEGGLPLLTLPPETATSGFVALDATRITVGVSSPHNGFAWDELLHGTWAVTAELPTLGHLTFVPSLGTTPVELRQLVTALRHLGQATTEPLMVEDGPLPPWPTADLSRPLMSPRDAYFAEQVAVPWEQAVDQISAELICPYPPGIPIVVPGERLTSTMLEYLRQVAAAGGHITGCADPHLLMLRVVRP